MVLSSVGPRVATDERRKLECVELRKGFATVTAQRRDTVASVERRVLNWTERGGLKLTRVTFLDASKEFALASYCMMVSPHCDSDPKGWG